MATQGPIKGAPAGLTRGMRADAAYAVVIQACTAHLAANERGMLRGTDPEYLHQMRVALRRIRSATGLFSTAAHVDAKVPLRADLKWISRQFGAARDWDVFVTQTLPRAESDLGRTLPALAALARIQRRRSGAGAKRAARSDRYRKLRRALAATRPSPPVAPLQPLVEDYAAAVLDWCHEELRKAGGRWPAGLPARALHRFRIALKKFRYATQFFFGLFEPRAERVARRRLSKLQDILGAINDAAVAKELAAAASGGAKPKPSGRARQEKRLVEVWSQQRIAALRKDLAPAWKEFESGRKFW